MTGLNNVIPTFFFKKKERKSWNELYFELTRLTRVLIITSKKLERRRRRWMKIIREARGMRAPIRAINMMGRERLVWVAVGKVSQNQEKRHARSYTSQKWGPSDSCSNLFLSLPPFLFLISSKIYLFIYLTSSWSVEDF